MITLTGQIDLNTEAAPDVALRQGDTMRQSEFEVKQDIDLENCSVDVFMVKPDQTFVISTCSITDDGKILISWPEQAAAVKGLGEYCIRISDNNSGYVFSARGRVWIDDHCILDSMIESVAEVNGYTFPDDFATKDEVPIIDDDSVSDNKVWSSAKLDDIFTEFSNAIQNIQDFSTNERVIGKWINGKPLYEKSYPFTTGSGANTFYYVNHDLTDLDIVWVNTSNSMVTKNNSTTNAFPYNDAQPEELRVGVDHTRIYYRVGSSYTSGAAVVTLRYTKTTD